MNSFVSKIIGASLMGLFVFGPGQVSAQNADLNEIGTDPRRALIVEIMIREDGTTEFLEAYVTDVPPGSSIGNPEQMLVESLDASLSVISSEYSWDPRWMFIGAAQPDDDGQFGEVLEILPEALGSFSVPFSQEIDSVRISDVVAVQNLITVDVQTVVEQYCIDNPGDSYNCFVPPPFIDTDLDDVPDDFDNCIEVANHFQTDTDFDGYGNACDADLNNDNFVNSLDLGLFKIMFMSTGEVPADFNGDLFVNSLDLGLFKQMFFKPPGPSALVP